MSNLFVYIATYVLIRLNDDDDPSTGSDSKMTRADAPKFMYLSFIVCGLGLVFQLVFHTGTNEKHCLSDEQIRSHSMPNSIETRLDWLGYLKNARFYNVGVLYMCTRLIVNMTQVYLPMYLTDTLELNKVFYTKNTTIYLQ